MTPRIDWVMLVAFICLSALVSDLGFWMQTVIVLVVVGMCLRAYQNGRDVQAAANERINS